MKICYAGKDSSHSSVLPWAREVSLLQVSSNCLTGHLHCSVTIWTETPRKYYPVNTQEKSLANISPLVQSSRGRMWLLAGAPSHLWGYLELRHFWTRQQIEWFAARSRKSSSAFDSTHYLMLQNDFSRDYRVLKSTEKGFFILASAISCKG